MSQSGRTTAMIRALPDAGAIIVVPSKTSVQPISDMILELRGPDFDKRCDVVAVTDHDTAQQLLGAKRWIAFDHTFRVMTPRALADEVYALARISNYQFPLQ